MHILKYCCNKRTKNSLKFKKIKKGFAFLLCGFFILFFVTDGIIREVISGYPMTVSAGVISEIMDKAMNDVLSNKDIHTNLVDEVVYGENGNVLSIESNSAELLKTKTEFTKAFLSRIKNYGDCIKISVPLGTLIGNEYTVGRGPRVSFNLQFNCSLSTELKSKFIDAGVNNTLHTIELCVTANIYIIIPWGHNSKTVSTKYILSETAIVGNVPDAFTNIHGADDEITDDIVDHGAELK